MQCVRLRVRPAEGKFLFGNFEKKYFNFFSSYSLA